MKVLCKCGKKGDDFRSKLRAAGWVQRNAALSPATSSWLCPLCTIRTEVMPTMPDIHFVAER
jgi:hypothetical protein